MKKKILTCSVFVFLFAIVFSIDDVHAQKIKRAGRQTSYPRIIAHRGYWDTLGSAQNSLSSLQNAQSSRCYGSEFDVIVTFDGIPVINHDASIDKFPIEQTNYLLLKDIHLKNGEVLPTLKDYLLQGKKNKNTKLVLEIKPHQTVENEDRAVEIITRSVKEARMERQVEYISFSLHICQKIREQQKQVPVSYLGGNCSPREIDSLNLSGIDYNYRVFLQHPEWIKEARERNLTVNVWTVNEVEQMKQCLLWQVDFITTDKPIILQQQIKYKLNNIK
ncbi:MAG: glycerophosphodiester phosphodiesterase [Bacteroidales bacterium]|jgi:glycerophosphoryl diester phosphodiesterase|nr:glycerophosphodiester phosphodiesterase [Bacteroidales bacterium]